MSPHSDSVPLMNRIRESRELFAKDELEKSMQILQEVKSEAATLGFPLVLAQADFRIGLIFLRMEDPVHALESLKSAYDLYKKGGAETSVVYCLSNMAIAYAQNEDYANSIASFQELASIYSSNKDTFNYSKTMVNLSHAYALDQNWVKSLDCIEKVRAAMPGHSDLETNCKLRKAVALKGLGRIQEAEPLLRELWEETKDSPQLEIEATILKNLAEIYENQNDIPLALQKYKWLLKINDSLNLLRCNKAVYDMEMRYRLAAKDRDLAIEHQGKILLRQQTWMAVTFLISAIFLLVFFLLRIRMKHYRSAAENTVLNEEVKRRKTTLLQLDVQGKEISHLLNRLQENITDLKKSKSLDSDNYFSLKNTLDQMQHLMNTWTMVVDDKNIDFMFRLEHKYPELTQVEKKTCMLLYINMTTKDIARSFNISEKSVNNTRSRIRCKLNIPNETPISEFLRDNIATQPL